MKYETITQLLQQYSINWLQIFLQHHLEGQVLLLFGHFLNNNVKFSCGKLLQGLRVTSVSENILFLYPKFQGKTSTCKVKT